MRASEHEGVDEEAISLLLDGTEDNTLSFAEMRQVLVSGELRRGDCGRHFVLLSLAEAETIRCILHMRQGHQLTRLGHGSGLAMHHRQRRRL